MTAKEARKRVAAAKRKKTLEISREAAARARAETHERKSLREEGLATYLRQVRGAIREATDEGLKDARVVCPYQDWRGQYVASLAVPILQREGYEVQEESGHASAERSCGDSSSGEFDHDAYWWYALEISW